MSLSFSMDDPGEWTAMSEIGHDGVNFIWRIIVIDTDSELKRDSKPVACFESLRGAKAYCEMCEGEMVADFAYWASVAKDEP